MSFFTKRAPPLLLLLCASCHGGADPPRELRRNFGGPGREVGNAVVQLEDDGFVIVGYTDSFGSGGTDVYLIRTDRFGNTVWTRTFGGSGEDFGWDVLRRMTVASS